MKPALWSRQFAQDFVGRAGLSAGSSEVVIRNSCEFRVNVHQFGICNASLASHSDGLTVIRNITERCIDT